MKEKIMLLLVLVACAQIPEENGGPIEIYFCPRDNCTKLLIESLNVSSIHCAFFDVDGDVAAFLEGKAKTSEVKLVTDNENKNVFSFPVKKDTSKQFTHNKFCALPGRIITGSFNPAESEKNNANNMLIIPSAILSQNYEDEFKEIWGRGFGRGYPVAAPKLLYNNISIENYFCPDDHCQEKVIRELKKARSSIYFMLFTITDEGIADALLMQSVEVRGITEKLNANGKYSQISKLLGFDINITIDNKKEMMHHKVFIIDNETVITGSYNPTFAGDKKN